MNKFTLVFKQTGRPHPYKEGTNYNTRFWGFKGEHGEVYDTKEEAIASSKVVVEVKAEDVRESLAAKVEPVKRRAPRKKAIKK